MAAALFDVCVMQMRSPVPSRLSALTWKTSRPGSLQIFTTYRCID